MKRLSTLIFLGIIQSLFVSSLLKADENLSCERFSVPNDTELELCIPKNWVSNIAYPPNGLPPTIAIHPNNSNDPYIKITVFWNINNSNDFNKIQSIRKEVLKTGNEFLSGAVEKTLPLKELKNKQGYYYRITDKAPKVNDYKYMSQGAMALGKLQLIFTILTNSPDSHSFNLALSIIEEAQQL
jgi:hypothetical protein